MNSASQQALAHAGSPSVAAWIGSVFAPLHAARRLPQRGDGDGAGRGQRKRAVEWNIQREPDELCERRLAGRRVAAQRAFDKLNAEVVVRTVK